MKRSAPLPHALLLAAALLGGLACSVFSPRPQPTAIGPTAASPTIDAPTERPADFTASYHWAEGSLPPPFHYEYTIDVAADGTVTLTYVPDYPNEGVPEWVETVSLDAAQLDALY